MKTINDYRKRFYNLMESTIGDVKPLMSEQSERPVPTPTPNPGFYNRPLPEPVTPTRPSSGAGVGTGAGAVVPPMPPMPPAYSDSIEPTTDSNPTMPPAYSNSIEPTKSGEGYLGTALSVHKVASGENLTSIAKSYGVTVDQILKSNPQIKDKNMIKVGEIINIER